MGLKKFKYKVVIMLKKKVRLLRIQCLQCHKQCVHDLLECKFNTLANHIFHRISDDVIQEIGLPLGEKVFPLWQSWLNKEVKKRQI